MSAKVVRQMFPTATLTPQVSIAVTVDTAFVAAQAGEGRITKGVSMMDNGVREGSTGEGTLGLRTVCNAGCLIGFQVIPVDAAGSAGDRVIITGFATFKGNVFTGAGHPVQQRSIGNLPQGSYWIGQAMRAGSEEYQIQIRVTVGQLQPVQYYVWWNATLAAS